jgi:hypothetical protein
MIVPLVLMLQSEDVAELMSSYSVLVRKNVVVDVCEKHRVANFCEVPECKMVTWILGRAERVIRTPPHLCNLP